MVACPQTLAQVLGHSVQMIAKQPQQAPAECDIIVHARQHRADIDPRQGAFDPLDLFVTDFPGSFEERQFGILIHGTSTARLGSPLRNPFDQGFSKLLGINGLWNMSVHPGLDTGLAVLRHGRRRDGNDRQIAEPLHLADVAGGLQPSHHRHMQIHEYGIA